MSYRGRRAKVLGEGNVLLDYDIIPALVKVGYAVLCSALKNEICSKRPLLTIVRFNPDQSTNQSFNHSFNWLVEHL